MAYGGFIYINGRRRGTREESCKKHKYQPEYGDEQTDAGLPNPSRETRFSGANTDREMLIFPVQLTTSMIGSVTRLIHTLAKCVAVHVL